MLFFLQLRALQPVYKSEIKDIKPLKCHLFTVKKFLTNGKHDKMSFRMVANRNEQDLEMYL